MLAEDAQSLPSRLLEHFLGSRDLRHELLVDVLLAIRIAYLIPIESLVSTLAIGLRKDLSIIVVGRAVSILTRAVQVAHAPNEIVAGLLERRLLRLGACALLLGGLVLPVHFRMPRELRV